MPKSEKPKSQNPKSKSPVKKPKLESQKYKIAVASCRLSALERARHVKDRTSILQSDTSRHRRSPSHPLGYKRPTMGGCFSSQSDQPSITPIPGAIKENSLEIKVPHLLLVHPTKDTPIQTTNSNNTGESQSQSRKVCCQVKLCQISGITARIALLTYALEMRTGMAKSSDIRPRLLQN